MKGLELLAPAGNLEALQTAINSGADAVYLGLQNFNARASADNFNEQNIKEVVRFAHKFGVKIFVTVNTLVKNSEMKELLNTVKSAVEAKVDAFLVQDLGVFSVLKKCFPGINLHASTQLGIHNLKGAQMAEKLGFSRIVLSREAKLEDIKEIKQKTNLEIEYFVQGALCIAFSGNCYFSGFMQNESGNRGRCKQYCRMKYTSNQNEDLDEKYLLSARDLCLLKNLKTLIDAGVTSFKIEGRLRRSGYVACAVSTFRRAIDNLQKARDFKQDIFNLKKVFSRGDFNEDAYLFGGTPNDVVNYDTQNHLGIEIGKVLDSKPFKDLSKVTIETQHKLKTGDGLKFLKNGKQILSLGVGNVEELSGGVYNIYTKHKIKKGYTVNLIVDKQMEDEFLEKTRKVFVQAKVFALAGKPLKCELKSGDITFCFEGENCLQQAKNSPLSKEDIAAQFSKLGGTDFEIDGIEVFSDNVFIPKSVLNEFRRKAFEEFEQKIVEHNEKSVIAKIDDKNLKNFEKFMSNSSKTQNSHFENIIVISEDEIKTVLEYKQNLKNSLIVLSPKTFSEKVFNDFENSFKGFNLGINLPIVANGKDVLLIEKILNLHKDFYIVSNNLYGMNFENRKIICGFGMNIFNNYAIEFLKSLGANYFVMSIENNVDEFCDNKNLFCYSMGYVPLMTFCHCPYKTLNKNTCNNCSFKEGLKYKDVLDNEFAIRRTRMTLCYFELLNSKFVNNISKHQSKNFVDLRGLEQNAQNNALKSVVEKEYKTITNSDFVGKIFESVN